MRIYMKWLFFIALLASISGCQAWDRYAFPVDLSLTGFFLKEKFSIKKSDIYSFSIGYQCECVGDINRRKDFDDFVLGLSGRDDRAKPLIRVKVTGNGRKFIFGTFEPLAPDSQVALYAKKKGSIYSRAFSWADLPVGEYEVELEVIRADLRLRKFKSYLAIRYSNPKI